MEPITTLAGPTHVYSPSPKIAAHAADLLTRLFRGLDTPVRVQLWNGTVLTLGDAAQVVGAASPHCFTLVCRSPAAVRAMALGRDPLRLAELYFRDEINVEGDFFAALGLKDHLRAISMSWLDRLGAALAAFALCLADRAAPAQTHERASLHGRNVTEHSRSENREAVAFHYDVSNEFYALWLDEAMVYSCAYFEQAGDDLERAQQAKLDHVCRKLLLRPGDRLLDIGCGWGALAIHAAGHYGVLAHGITLSRQQLALAQARIAQAGLQDRVSVELRDYRDLAGEALYDKVSSVGMFEHIGLKNLPVYFAKVYQLLKPGGLFLNHGITHDVEGWKKTLSSEFINRYVFPDGQLDTISNIQRVMERAHFEIADVESLRPHYALTLRHWVMRLEAHHEQALNYVSESTWRVWRLYMGACALEFESGEIGVYQVLASKRPSRAAALPLTRRHQYTGARGGSTPVVK
jgi:cyclopropane-fatty-acyl-phospholipid synthase